jgi:hypothetical protein
MELAFQHGEQIVRFFASWESFSFGSCLEITEVAQI